MTQARLLIGLVVAAVGCGGPAGIEPAPASPEAAIRGFMNAVRAGSLSTMGSLWGSTRGPARTYMAPEELEQRLLVIRTYLAHEQFEVVQPTVESLPAVDRRVIQVRLTRNGCTPLVPFTLVRHGDGWLISEIDLAAAGNPQRVCRTQQRTGNSGTSGGH